MLKNVCHQIFRLTKPRENLVVHLKSKKYRLCNRQSRFISTSSHRYAEDDDGRDSQSTELTVTSPKQIFEKEFPEFFEDGKFINRISYVDYIDQALEKMKELGLHKDLEAYKELLRVFPPGKYCPQSGWDIGLFHAPQQLCAIRLIDQMEQGRVKPDKEFETLVIQAFSKHSDVWVKLGKLIYWSMKGRNLDPNPLPERISKKPHEMAKAAVMRMLDDPKSLIFVRNTSSVPNVVDKTWIVYSQSPLQQAIIERLDPSTLLYIENQGVTYVNDDYLSYFVLKVYDDEETIKRRAEQKESDYNFNTLKMRFFGKPIKEKLEDMDKVHHIDDGHILGIAITGTSSQDSLLSWLKLLQQRNPKLNSLNVVFKAIRPTMEVLDPGNDPDADQRRQNTGN